jgi:hypothetical protein
VNDNALVAEFKEPVTRTLVEPTAIVVPDVVDEEMPLSDSSSCWKKIKWLLVMVVFGTLVVTASVILGVVLLMKELEVMGLPPRMAPKLLDGIEYLHHIFFPTAVQGISVVIIQGFLLLNRRCALYATI